MRMVVVSPSCAGKAVLNAAREPEEAGVKRGFVTLLAMPLLVAACEGGQTEEPASPSSTTGTIDDGTQASSADTSTSKPEASEVTASSGGEGNGTTTIGDMTWEFALSGGTCDLDVNDAGLVFVVQMFGTGDDGREIALNMSGPITGGEAVVVQAGSPTLEFERWTADRSVYDRLSGIEGMPEGVGATIQVDGNTVSGSGVFYDDTTLNQVRPTGGPYDAGVLEGTFSVTCPAK